ncbi:MAG TPA: serine hydrolase [Gemmatimonadaceae bacterium]|nr:serine hydrolase [Gemmatimonadaceae bacterium]
MISLLVAAFSLAAGDGDKLPSAAPLSVGMSAERLEAIDRVVARGVSAGGYPGAAIVVGRKGSSVWSKGFGFLSWNRASGDVDPNSTIYDLASLTKVVGLTMAAMVLFDEGKLSLDAPVVEYLPEFAGGGRDPITIRQLLTHRSGLPAGRDVWRVARSPEQARAMLLETALACKPDRCYIYSDIGADILGFAIERISGQSLDHFLDERVFGPLGMTDTFFRPADSLRARIAPTDLTPPRGYPLRGQVHDENAFALGGVAGHAGLFSTAGDLAVYAQMMLNGGHFNGVRVVSDSAVAIFTARARGSRALGWDTSNGGSGAGEYLSPSAYGHTGFTGTSMWIDPEREMFVILLTNRVHAARAKRPATVIADVRADVADLAALAVIDSPDGILEMPAALRADMAVDWNRPVPVRRAAKRRAPVKKPVAAPVKRVAAPKPSGR